VRASVASRKCISYGSHGRVPPGAPSPTDSTAASPAAAGSLATPRRRDRRDGRALRHRPCAHFDKALPGRIARRLLAAAAGCLLAVGCSDEGPPAGESVLPDSADQIIHGFTTHITVDGVERAKLEADSAYHYPARESYDLFNLRVEFRTPRGELRSTLTALTGTYNWRTADMVARDSVLAVTPDGRRLTTCAIEYTEDRDEISGPCAFVYNGPSEHMEGESFTADPDFRNVTAVRPRGTVRDVERNP